MNLSDLGFEVGDTFLVVVCLFTVSVKYAAQWGKQRHQLASCRTADEIYLSFYWRIRDVNGIKAESKFLVMQKCVKKPSSVVVKS